jgi:predicted porin
MNNTIKLAVASALLAAASSASAAGGIVAGDWTLDIGGVVNAYYTSTKANVAGAQSVSNITTGLLPNYLAISGKTRQNDLDVGFTISINPGASTTNSGIQFAQQENRQAFLTFGDASWGSMKLGKDLGIYASDAILNDMTLLGVGSGAGALAGNTTTLGRIGTGFMYADWKAQVAYTSPNFNGFQFTVGATQAWNEGTLAGLGNLGQSAALAGGENGPRGGNQPAFEGKVSYSFAADAVNGKVWASGITQNMEARNQTSSAWDLGVNVNANGFGATAYYGEGRGLGTGLQFNQSYDAFGDKRDSRDWYLQGTYAVPGVGTKLGVSYGESQLNYNAAEAQLGNYVNEMWTFGAYHPITKHLNLVAEYSQVQTQNQGTTLPEAETISLGAILFF